MKKLVIRLLAILIVSNSFASESVFYFETSDNVRLYVRIAGQGKP